IAKAYIALESGRITGVGLALIFLFFFARGIQGTFTYHRLRHREDPDYRAAPVSSYVLGIPVTVALFVAVSAGVLTNVGIFPATAVVDGEQLTPGNIALLKREGIVRPDEEIQLFYSTGVTSIRNEGNILTNQRVVSYERVEDQLFVHQADIGE